MIKTILKSIIKAVVGIVVIRIGVLAVGVYLATGGIPGLPGIPGLGGGDDSSPSLTDYRDMALDSMEKIGQLLGR